jgi:hypothetical protein
VVKFEILPEQQDQLGGQASDRLVVEARLALVQVVDEHVPHRAAGNAVAVDDLLDR